MLIPFIMLWKLQEGLLYNFVHGYFRLFKMDSTNDKSPYLAYNIPIELRVLWGFSYVVNLMKKVIIRGHFIF